MFNVIVPVILTFTTEARAALGPQLRAAGVAMWREIAASGAGLELSHVQIRFDGIWLAACSWLRGDGKVAIEIGLGDPACGGRVIPAAELRRAGQRLQAHQR
ncbi:hypothetical protein [Acidisphaera rubrifaciens]|uniref:Uncharacterized protein n=1 Tax=Acidisphaera rubrifaciens HS-AP3 TaxID=1231350 RepID=A0A0D6PAL2_9PROT|nr:hypothetical protein [Acidisphaera rubrifaciens]GAN78233.1 hypothetical protein Asru_0693_03 [Acidisphaera rubrifaciens HS-AP3]